MSNDNKTDSRVINSYDLVIVKDESGYPIIKVSSECTEEELEFGTALDEALMWAITDTKIINDDTAQQLYNVMTRTLNISK